MKKTIIFVIISLLLASCGHRNVVVFDGTILGADGCYLSVSRTCAGEVLQSDSALVRDGRFYLEMPVESTEAEFYCVTLGENNSFTTLASRGETISIEADAASLAKSYDVKGGPDAVLMCQLDKHLALFADSTEFLVNLYNQYVNDDSLRAEIESAYVLIKGHHQQYLRDFIQKNPQSLACLAAFYQRYNQCLFFSETDDHALLESVYSSLSKKYPENGNVIWLKKRLENQQSAK